MRQITIATIATTAPMGQQVYEESICARAAGVLGPGWTVDRAIVRSLRSPLEGTVRLPGRLLSDGGLAARAAAGRIAYRKASIVHRMDLRLPPAAGPEILTVHDAVSWRFPDEAWPPACAREEAERAVRLICPSAFSANELSRFLRARDITVIHNGVDENFFTVRPLPEQRLRELGLVPPFVLHAGGGGLRKNLEALAAAWPTVRQARPDVALVLMGSRDPRKERLLAALDGTVMLGRLDMDLARAVMASAAAIVVPSVYEGFGLPALEGMAAGVPVVASNRSSLPEVCGDGAILVEPTDAGIAEGLLGALEGGGDVADLVARGRERASTFSWDTSAARHAEVWNSV